MNHFISLAQAVVMTSRYRQQKENLLTAAYRNQNILALSESFDRAALDAVLAQEGCAGLRIYYGMDEDFKVHAVLVGTDGEGNDLLPNAGRTDGTGPEPMDLILEKGNRCPDNCPPDSPLQTDND